jgi:hypothetical protein
MKYGIRKLSTALLLCAASITPLIAQVPAVVSGAVDRSLATIAVPRLQTEEAAQRLTDALNAIARRHAESETSGAGGDRQVVEDSAIEFIRWLE